MAITEQDDATEVESTPVPQGPAGQSILDHLRHRREDLAREDTPELLLEVPRWNGALAIRYRYPESGASSLIRAAEKAMVSGDTDKAFESNQDVLIACCHEVVGRVPDGDWERLDPSDDRPVKFTARLANLLHIDLPEGGRNPNRFVLRHVFSPAAGSTGVYDGDVGLMVQAGNVVAWLQGGMRSSLGRVEGE